jgi:hypothetical protein
MAFHVPNDSRNRTHPQLASTDEAGNNGAFVLPSCQPGWHLSVIASDGLGWEHVSVHAHRVILKRLQMRTPTWSEMCLVKDIFWDAEDTVVQFHPPRSAYVNQHPHCLHLWRPTAGDLPAPPSFMVGTKEE